MGLDDSAERKTENEMGRRNKCTNQITDRIAHDQQIGTIKTGQKMGRKDKRSRRPLSEFLSTPFFMD